MYLSFSPNVFYKTLVKFLGSIHLYIYIEHKGIIGFWSNGLTKAREKIES